MEELGAEMVLAGIPMLRRSHFQFGGALAKGERGQVDAGLGKRTGAGTSTLLPPTDLIVQPVEHRTGRGGHEVSDGAADRGAGGDAYLLPAAPAAEHGENTTRHLHNFIPLRGAQARDTRVWSDAIATSMELFGAEAEILVAQHHWPTWGNAKLLAYLARQRDLYKHIHDQTLRLAAHGLRPSEIAERLRLPETLAQDWACRGYYGTVSHNSKAVYQRYLSWYDGNPANLNPLPPVEAGRKLMEYLGPLEAVMERARADFGRGEYRWVAQLMSQLVFADAGNEAARALLADAYEQLGYQAESATWRNAYLLAAQELRSGIRPSRPIGFLRGDMLPALATAVVFDWLAVRLDAEKATGLAWKIRLALHRPRRGGGADPGERYADTEDREALRRAARKGHHNAHRLRSRGGRRHDLRGHHRQRRSAGDGRWLAPGAALRHAGRLPADVSRRHRCLRELAWHVLRVGWS